jgi:hypothetical protein
LHTWEDINFDRERYMRRARYLALVAQIVWGFSFLALLCYLNAALACVAFVFVIIAGLCMGPASRYFKKT